MALNMRSDFLGAHLRSAQVSKTTPAGKLQVQALFGGGAKKTQKKAQKTAKGGTQKFGGIVKQAQKTVKQAGHSSTMCAIQIMYKEGRGGCQICYVDHKKNLC